MANKKSENIIHMTYSKAKDFRWIFANGVFGGVSPYGEIQMNFFVERQKIPDEEEYVIDKEQLRLRDTDRRIEYEREVQVGISVQPNIAKSIANWILKNLKEIEEKTKGDK